MFFVRWIDIITIDQKLMRSVCLQFILIFFLPLLCAKEKLNNNRNEAFLSFRLFGIRRASGRCSHKRNLLQVLFKDFLISATGFILLKSPFYSRANFSLDWVVGFVESVGGRCAVRFRFTFCALRDDRCYCKATFYDRSYRYR